MPIGAWNCPVCKRNDLPLDHYKTSAECGRKIHPDYIDAVLQAETGHYRFGTRDIGVTDLIGCPRGVAGSRELFYSANPKDLMAMSNGTAWDQWVTAGQEKESLRGTLGGIEIIGEPDRIRDGVIEDWKKKSEYSLTKIKNGPDRDHICQVSIYAHLKRQGDVWRKPEWVESGRIWYQFSFQCIAHDVTLMSEEEILTYKPVNGETTIGEHLKILDAWKNGNQGWTDMKLIGEQQTYGKKSKCDYCSVAGPCREKETGAPY